MFTASQETATAPPMINLHVSLPPPLPTQPGTISIWKEPPGSGKSYRVREEVAQALQNRTLCRVVWAVSDTLADDSLGQEAADHFRRLGVKVSIVKGVKHHCPTQTYRKQFTWSTEPEVKIVPFACLPLIFGDQTLYQKLAPELLVIDEWPLSGLMISLELTLAELTSRFANQAIAQQLQVLMQQAIASQLSTTKSKNTDLRRHEEIHFYTGAEFLTALGNQWTQQEWLTFTDLLSNTNSGPRLGKSDRVFNTPTIVSALQEDLKQPLRNSYRFGLSWCSNNKRIPIRRSVKFYGHVRLSLEGLPPTLILDAYAEQMLYDALFPKSTVQVTGHAQPAPLRVEVAPDLQMHALSLKKRESPQKYLQIAEEVLLLHQQSPVSLLLNKEQQQEDSYWKQALHDAARHLGLPPSQLPAELYHHAGRGRNTHAGRTIVSLMYSGLPQVHELTTMAGLFPHDPQQRREAHLKLEQAERLQMLHRGRQSSHSAVRIIAAFDPGLPAALCTVMEYQPKLKFKKGSDNPRWRDAVTAVSQELVDQFGGVPKASLAALGLLRIEGMTAAVQAAHRTHLTCALRQATLPMDSLLRSWSDTGSLGRYADVKPRAKKSAALLDEVMSSLSLIKSGNQTKTVGGRKLVSLVYYQQGTTPEQVFSRIYP